MKVAIFPDTSYMLYDLVKKNGHEPITVLSEYEKSRIDSETGINEGAPPYNMTRDNPIQGIKYATCEAPSGVRGRMSLFGPIIEEVDAAIFMNFPSINKEERMYDSLNSLLIFGCDSCINTSKFVKILIKKRNISFLDINYPTTCDEIIEMINDINEFLRDLVSNKQLIIKKNKKVEDKITVDMMMNIINNNK